MPASTDSTTTTKTVDGGKASASTPPPGSFRSLARQGTPFFKSWPMMPSRSSETRSSSTTAEPSEQELMRDIMNARKALDLFLNSRISECEAILKPELCQKSMYYALSKAVMLSLKSMMTFQHADFEEAIEAMRHAIRLTDTVRKRAGGWLYDNLSSLVRSISAEDVKHMKPVQRHAELVHAEAHMIKAMLCIVHDESLISFLREGLNVRKSYNIYCAMEKFLQQQEEDGSIELDEHLKSGILFGMGCFHVMLSLLPSTALRLIEFVGFSSDRAYGMHLLESSGGWDMYRKTGKLPSRQGGHDGLRRQFCDILLIAYHVLLAKLIPVSDADDAFGAQVLAYNLDLYPNGVFFLYFYGRQLFGETKLDEADAQYIRAIETQKDWVQLQHMCYWERGLISVLKQDWHTAAEMYETLYRDSNWSKAVYTYFKALSLYMLSVNETDEEKRHSLRTEAMSLMKKVDGAKQKIAGKSIPLEKFVARKSRKFIEQDGYLFLPDLEVANAFGACDYLPAHLLRANIERIQKELARLDRSSPNYADDLCLGNYLLAMMARLLLTRTTDQPDECSRLRQIHRESLHETFEQAKNIRYDHYIYYFARYENARMMIYHGEYDSAEAEIQVILKANEKGQYNIGAGRHAKNKYSLENSLLFKSHNCMAEIRDLKASSSSKDKEDSDSFASASSNL